MKANTLYKIDISEDDSLYADHIDYYKHITGNHPVLCLGEVTNFPGTYIMVNATGKIMLDLPPEIFSELTEEDVINQ